MSVREIKKKPIKFHSFNTAKSFNTPPHVKVVITKFFNDKIFKDVTVTETLSIHSKVVSVFITKIYDHMSETFILRKCVNIKFLRNKISSLDSQRSVNGMKFYLKRSFLPTPDLNDPLPLRKRHLRG